MSGLAQLSVWNDPAVRDALSWYLAVAENRRPAKFRIAATSPRTWIFRCAGRKRCGPNSTA